MCVVSVQRDFFDGNANVSKPILFTLKPNLQEAGRTWHCPDCATITGVLSYHPEVAAKLDWRQVDFARPRPAVIELIGSENQGCPVLILPEGAPLPAAEFQPKSANGRVFISDVRAIANYLATTYGASYPH